jgi:hypothetical protein
VQYFNPGPPATVTVTIAINEDVQWNVNGPEGSLDIQVQKMTIGSMDLGQGVIQDVPVCIPTAGGYSLTFPIAQGDECLLIFNDLEIDNWLQNGGDPPVNTISSRRHDLSDAIAVFGLRSTPKALQDYSTNSTQLRSDDGTVVIDLANNAITITAPVVQLNATDVQVNAETVEIAGSSSVSISGAGNVTIDSKNFLLHEHTGVQTGGGFSGPVR